MKDKLFFFAAQEWVNYSPVQTNTVTVPTAKMRRGDFSELLDPNNGFFSARADHPRSADRPAVPGNIIPADRLSAERHRDAERLSDADPGLPPGNSNAIVNSAEPAGSAQGQHPLRLPDERQQPVHLPLLASTTGRRSMPSAAASPTRAPTGIVRTRTQTRELDEHAEATTIVNETSYTFSLDEVFINVFQSDLYKRSIRHQLSVHLPGQQGDPGQDPDDHHRRPHRDRRRPVSVVVARPDPHVLEHHHLGQEPPHLQGRRRVRVSGEDDFDQINVSRFPAAPTTRTAASSSHDGRAGANQHGVSTRRSACSRTTRRSASARCTKWRALATDMFIQDSWRPAEQPERLKGACATSSGRRSIR